MASAGPDDQVVRGDERVQSGLILDVDLGGGGVGAPVGQRLRVAQVRRRCAARDQPAG